MSQPSKGERSSVSITSTIESAVEAYRRGYMPLPILDRSKRPGQAQWTQHTREDYPDEEAVRTAFTGFAEQGWGNVGVALGEPSGGLIDVDLDHPKTIGLKRFLLPATAAKSGRLSRPTSHFWYRVDGELPSTRRYKMPDGSVSVELRSTRGQTVIPTSTHPSGETYRWEGEAWGGADGPRTVDGKMLSTNVALLALGTVLVENWPTSGGRHDAYLALCGGLLRLGQTGVNSLWEQNLPYLIEAMAEATHDEDGPETRVSEAMHTTLGQLRSEEGRATGWPTLAEIIGDDHVKAARRLKEEVESLWGYEPQRDYAEIGEAERRTYDDEDPYVETGGDQEDGEEPTARPSTWTRVDWEPILAGDYRRPDATLLTRRDGPGLMYRGRMNMLYGRSESAKSWVALYACLQEMSKGERVLYLDFEDEPGMMMERLFAMGAGPDDIRTQFGYMNPTETLAPMSRDKWGKDHSTAESRARWAQFQKDLETFDPTLIVVDALTGLFGMHGQDSNDSTATEIVSQWASRLTRKGRSTVILIDHTTKAPSRTTAPIGAERKVGMIRGTILHVWSDIQPAPGVLGKVDLVVYKDTPGSVRQIAAMNPSGRAPKTPVAAAMYLDSREEGSTRISLVKPKAVLDGDQASIDARDERIAKDADEAVSARMLRENFMARVFGGDHDLLLGSKEIQERWGSPWDDDLYQKVSGWVADGYMRKEGRTKGTKYGLFVEENPRDEPEPQP